MNPNLIRLLLSAFLLTSGLAARQATPTPPPPRTAGRAVLTHVQTGRQFVLPVATRFQALGHDLYEATYIAEIPTAVLAAYEYNEKSQNDPTRSASVTINQTYSRKTSGSDTYIAVHYYKGKWVRLDPAVTVTQMRINAACDGGTLGGGTCNYNTWSPYYINPASGSWRTYTPSWAGLYVRVNDLEYQAGSTRVWLKRGTSTWIFTVTVFAVP